MGFAFLLTEEPEPLLLFEEDEPEVFLLFEEDDPFPSAVAPRAELFRGRGAHVGEARIQEIARGVGRSAL